MSELPKHAYRPSSKGEPLLRSFSDLRARLFAGGTYFRYRNTGQEGNRASIQVVADGTTGVCIVTNYNTNISEMVTGPVEVITLVNGLGPLEYILIDQLTTQPRAAVYSISAQIGGADTLISTTSVSLDSLISIGNTSLRVKSTRPYTVGDTIRVQPRIQRYPLTFGTVELPPDPNAPPVVPPDLPPPPETVTGFLIEPLRSAINAADPWIEMLPRGFDQQDLTAPDDPVLTPFAEQFLVGGDGLPTHPSGQATGPTRSLIHVNYGEAYDGGLTEVSTVYEWVGDSASLGSWQQY